MIKRVPTGIDQFDDLIKGGFKKNSVNLVAGKAGTGKTIMAMQYLINGVKKFNENALYITFEEKKTYKDMMELGWDLKRLEGDGKFIYMEYSPEQVKKVLVEGGGIIETIIEKNNIKRLVIDSITSFSLLYQDELTKKEASLALFELIDKWNCTAILTSQDQNPDETIISAAIEFEVDSIILLYHVKQKGIRTRAIEILKMRGTDHPDKTMVMDITNNGIKIFPDKIAEF